uniref:Uncharacterized protein n=1 Tax=Globodera rostochiensis TaxID=31243 RepID=A0A914H4X9_GLORO
MTDGECQPQILYQIVPFSPCRTLIFARNAQHSLPMRLEVNHQEVLSSALEEQHQRCRRLALQSFRAAKEMKTGSAADVVAVEPKWEPHCMLCLINEAMFGQGGVRTHQRVRRMLDHLGWGRSPQVSYLPGPL